MMRTDGWLVVAMAILCACSSTEATSTDEGAGEGAEDDDATSGPDTGGVESAPATSGATMTSTSGPDATSNPGSAEESGDDEGQSFVVPPDGGSANECDPKVQDCPDGQKCTAWANDGGTFWNANRCVAITGEGVEGDPCLVEGSGVSGVDDCATGYICMYTNEKNIGTCIAFCEGESEDCNPGSVCAIYNDGVLPICLVSCDPLLQNCPEMQSCIDTPNGAFICFTDASGETGLAGDPCPAEHGENSCDPGLWCGAGASGCEAVNCCTPYCDLGDPTCASPNECISFFGEGNAPPGYEEVGVCIVPQ
jgi:hypothetical protein